MRVATWGRVVAVALVVVAGEACARRAEVNGAMREALDVGTHARANVITAAELASAGAAETIDAVRRLRPSFLRGSVRVTRVSPEIAVYVNDQYDGDVGSLTTIPLRVIQEIVFLEPVEAHVRFGPWCPCANGALLVTTRTGRGTG